VFYRDQIILNDAHDPVLAAAYAINPGPASSASRPAQA
jgi:hypothetical protein